MMTAAEINTSTNLEPRAFVGLLILFAALFSTSALADPVLPGLFSDHMVLQRGRDVPVWGWADPGETITVTLEGVSRQTIAGKDRRWKITLPSMKAGGPWLMTVQGNRTVLLKDVLVGEVWVLSGQSNMTFALSGAEGAATAIPAANFPEIRLFTVPESDTLEAQQNVAAAWKICSPTTAGEFSAVAYFFGRELFQRLGVPIGLVHSSWPGTGAEEWAAVSSLEIGRAHV